MPEPDWQPGDPLHPRGNYGAYLFNFRDVPDAEQCLCSDRARWPEPRQMDSLDGYDDEVERFIAEERAAREDGAA